MYLSILWYCKGESIQRLLPQHDLEGWMGGGIAIDGEMSDLPKACIIAVVNEMRVRVSECAFPSDPLIDNYVSFAGMRGSRTEATRPEAARWSWTETVRRSFRRVGSAPHLRDILQCLELSRLSVGSLKRGVQSLSICTFSIVPL